MMTFPEYYRHYFRVYLKFSIVMTMVALLLGITFQESAKKTPFSDVLPPGVHLETLINLALVHGHAFLIGVLLPLGVTWMLYLGQALNFKALSEKTLRIASWLYLPASALAIALMLYKGYHYQLGVRAGEMDFAKLNEAFFFGNHALRAAAYGLTHTAMAIGLSTIVLAFWKSMKEAR